MSIQRFGAVKGSVRWIRPCARLVLRPWRCGGADFACRV